MLIMPRGSRVIPMFYELLFLSDLIRNNDVVPKVVRIFNKRILILKFILKSKVLSRLKSRNKTTSSKGFSVSFEIL